MNAADAYKAALRDLVGPALRAHGFKGTSPTWRRTNELDDVAIVNVQASPWNTRDRVRCAVNLAVVPSPWRDWYFSSMASPPKHANESLGMFRSRLRGEEIGDRGDRWWEIADERDAALVAEEVVGLLVDHAIPHLVGLLERDVMLDAVRADRLGDISGSQVYSARCEAALLTDGGATAELDNALRRCAVEGEETAERFETWARARAGFGRR